MRQALRTLCLRTLCLLAAAACAVPPAPAQTGNPRAPKPRGARAAAESKNAQARRRQLAVAALLEAAEAARDAEHPAERVSLQADAADALWPLDEAAARALLRRAWETTTDPNALAAFRPKQEGGRFGPREMIRSARQSIINRAAKHDLKLAEGFMQEFERGVEEEEEEDAAATPADAGRREPSPLGRRRLWTARALLNDGDYEAAAAVAAPLVAEGPNVPFVSFLYLLRAQSPRHADPLYLRLLEQTRADARAGSNDVLLLSTPVISPALFVTVGADGSTSLRPSDSARPGAPEPEALPPPLRRAFFETAAAVLLRPTRARAGEAAGPFYAIGRLLPFFEREAPHHVAALRARAAALGQEMDESQRAAVSAQAHVERVTPRNPPDPLQLQLDWLARAADDAARDAARFDLVSAAVLSKLWERARQAAAEIADPKTRRAAFLLITAEQVKNVGDGFRDDDGADDFERAASFARAADVPAALRAHGLAQAAELAARKNRRQRAVELLGEAAALAAAVDRGTEARVALYALLAEAHARLDPRRAWGLLTEMTAAANERDARPESEDEPADHCTGLTVETAQNSYCVEVSEQVPEPGEVYASLARLDAERALAEARALKRPEARARALVDAARAAVEVPRRRGATP